jgi:hypothetical protein
MGLKDGSYLPPEKERPEDINQRMLALQRVIELERDRADVMEEMEFLAKRRAGIEEKLREASEELGDLLGFTNPGNNRHQMPQDGLARLPRVNA